MAVSIDVFVLLFLAGNNEKRSLFGSYHAIGDGVVPSDVLGRAADYYIRVWVEIPEMLQVHSAGFDISVDINATFTVQDLQPQNIGLETLVVVGVVGVSLPDEPRQWAHSTFHLIPACPVNDFPARIPLSPLVAPFFELARQGIFLVGVVDDFVGQPDAMYLSRYHRTIVKHRDRIVQCP